MVPMAIYGRLPRIPPRANEILFDLGPLKACHYTLLNQKIRNFGTLKRGYLPRYSGQPTWSYQIIL